MTRSTISRSVSSIAAACWLGVSLGIVSAPALAQVNIDSIFELDADAVTNLGQGGDDWDKVYGGTDSAAASTFISGVISEGPAVDVSYFTGGGSKDVYDIDQWLYSPGDVAPDKNDIIDAYAGAYLHNSELYIYFGLDRYAQTGSAQVGFWFFRKPVSLVEIPEGDNTGTFNGLHTARSTTLSGDILVLSDFNKGGKVSSIKVFEWVGDGSGSHGNLDLIYEPTVAECDGAATPACAIANADGIPSPWPYTPKSGPSGTIPAGGFFEGGVNLTELLGGNTGCFSSFLAETRSSGSAETAQLKDFALGKFELCGIDVQKSADIGQICNASGEQAITYTYTMTNKGSVTLDASLVDDNGTPGDDTDDVDVIASDANSGVPLLVSGNPQTVVLLPGAANAQTFSVTFMVSGSVTNEALATGTAAGSPDYEVTDTDTAAVVVKQCTIDISKTPDRTDVCSQNRAVNYGYVVTNTGEVAVELSGVVDDKGSPSNQGDDVELLAYNGLSVPYTLAVGESLPLSLDTELPEGEASVNNTVLASGNTADPSVPVTPVTANASAMVYVHTCSILVTKDCNDAEGEGQPITFYGGITNTGDVAITSISLGDSSEAGVQSISLPATTLLPGETMGYSGQYIPDQVDGDHTDVVTVNGKAYEGMLAETALSDTDDATCQILTAPSISVTKQCTDAAGFPPAAQHIGFSGTVTNEGNVTLNNVTVYDSQLGINVVDGISLAPGASASFNNSYEPTYTWNRNTVSASGYDAINGEEATDDASAVCQGCPFVPNPGADGTDTPTWPGLLYEEGDFLTSSAEEP